MAKPFVSAGALDQELRRRMGAITALEPLPEGEESRAFAFRAAGEACVVRVNSSAAGFEKDALAGRRFTGPALPVPEVVAIGSLADGNSYCVSRRAAGRTLQALGREALPAVLEPVARVMEAIAAADIGETRGFGRFDGRGVGEEPSWRAFLARIADPRRFAWPAADGFDRGAVERIIALVLRLAERCPEMRRLVHGDFGSNNVLTDGRQVTGIIDWADALFGDPLYDVANILFWRPWLDCMEQQARHFEASRPSWLANRDRLLCYQLRIGLEEVHANAVMGNMDMAAWALGRCEAIAYSPDEAKA